MDWLKIKHRINERIGSNLLIKILLLVLIVYFALQTDAVWKGILKTIVHIFSPFVIGFVIAYLLWPLVDFLEQKKISKKITIPVIFVLLIIGIMALVFSVAPMLYERGSQFVNQVINNINYLLTSSENLLENNNSQWGTTVIQQIDLFLRDFKNVGTSFGKYVPLFISMVFNFITSAMFTVIISIYFLFDYRKITNFIDSFVGNFNKDVVEIFKKIDVQIGSYLRSLLIIMGIKFVEYSLLYAFIGHREWLIIALLMSVGLIIPYFGAMIGNAIGILSSLTLAPISITILIIGIAILSVIDAYVIAPLIYMKESRIHPLWTLFSVFTGGVLFGTPGVIFAVPVYMMCRVIYTHYKSTEIRRTK